MCLTTQYEEFPHAAHSIISGKIANALFAPEAAPPNPSGNLNRSDQMPGSGIAALAGGASVGTGLPPSRQNSAILAAGENAMIIVVEIASRAGTRACKEYDALPTMQR